jgi:O-antigen/teichoic acid export membrane protein
VDRLPRCCGFYAGAALLALVRGDAASQSPRVPRFARAAASTFGSQVAVAVLSFASVLIVARSLGAEGRGAVALLTTISMLTSNVGLLGVDEANVNFAGTDPSLRRRLATNSVLLAAAAGAVCAAALGVLMWAFPSLGGHQAAWLRWLALVTVPFLILKVYVRYLVGADFRFGVANVSWLLPPFSAVVVNGALAAAGALTAATAFGTWVAGHVVATLLLVFYVHRRAAGFGRPDVALARRMLGFGYRSHVGRLMMAGNFRLDQWFVGAMAGTRELGLYSVAVAWSEALFYLPTALVIAQRPYLVRAERDDAARRAARVFRASAIVTAGMTAALLVLAPTLCTAVFGPGFAGSATQLRLLTLGAVGILALKLLGNALTAQRRPGLATVGATAAFVATVVLDLLLIPRYGGTGAAIASAVAYTVGGVAVAMVFDRFFGASARTLVPRPSEVPALVRSVRRALSRRAARTPRVAGEASPIR